MSAQRRRAEKEPAFEEAIERLEALVAELEGGDLPLEQSLKRFEEGVRLVRLCSDRLRTAEVRVRELEESSSGVRERELDVEEE
jgi:exodeoxyribonuclease VII small subunit